MNFSGREDNAMIFFLVLTSLFSFVQCQTGAASAVAFSAGVTKHLVYQHAETVIYDRVFTNIGSGYNSATGIFTCPTSGIYVFEFHTLARQDKSTWLELYHNSNYVVSLYSHTTSDYDSASNSAILKITKGDTVYVKAVDNQFGSDTNIYGQTDEVYTTFSGYLIAPVFEEIPAVGK